MALPVFISKSLQEVDDLSAFLANKNIPLVAHSFLSFERVESERPDGFDCLFFGSPRSVIFYFSRNSVPATTKVACSGQKTAQVLIELGHPPDFIAQQSGNIDETSAAFGAWNGNSTVLFALSETSHKSYTKHLSAENVLEMVVYRTIVTTKKVIDCSVYIFTSPSNVEGFLRENSFPSGASIIAWGQTTEQFIQQHGFVCDYVLTQSSEKELIHYLEDLFLE